VVDGAGESAKGHPALLHVPPDHSVQVRHTGVPFSGVLSPGWVWTGVDLWTCLESATGPYCPR
jgi:hypothetical protein